MNTLAKTVRASHRETPPFGSSRRPPPQPAAVQRLPEPAPIERVIAADGRQMLLREIQRDDVGALQRGFASLSPEEIRMRFLHPLNELPHEFAVRLCDLDPQYGVAYVLIDPPDAPE